MGAISTKLVITSVRLHSETDGAAALRHGTLEWSTELLFEDAVKRKGEYWMAAELERIARELRQTVSVP